jgi:chromosome segregation ATPase
MEGNIQTIEDLAALIMETMASKEDIKEVKDEMKGLATKDDIQELRTEMNQKFDSVETRLDHLDARVGRIEADIHELRGEIVYRHEFEDALSRIKYLEKKLGIESGV